MDLIMKELKIRGVYKDAQPNLDVLKSLFQKLDDDNDGYLTKHELCGLLYGLELQGLQSSTADAINKVMEEFDSSRDDKLSLDEFNDGMSSWLKIATSTFGHLGSNNNSQNFISDRKQRRNSRLFRMIMRRKLLKLIIHTKFI